MYGTETGTLNDTRYQYKYTGSQTLRIGGQLRANTNMVPGAWEVMKPANNCADSRNWHIYAAAKFGSYKKVFRWRYCSHVQLYCDQMQHDIEYWKTEDKAEHILLWTHKRCPISHPQVWAMGCPLRVFWRTQTVLSWHHTKDGLYIPVPYQRAHRLHSQLDFTKDPHCYPCINS